MVLSNQPDRLAFASDLGDDQSRYLFLVSMQFVSERDVSDLSVMKSTTVWLVCRLIYTYIISLVELLCLDAAINFFGNIKYSAGAI